MKDLSIVIVSYNTKELLSQCLESIKNSKTKLTCETFVVDNASDDGSAELVEKEFKWVFLIKNKTNLGFSKANNLALKKIKSEYVLILNPDTILDIDTISKMHSFMEKNTDISIATCKVIKPDGKLDRDSKRSFPTPWKAFTHFSQLSKIFPKTKLFDSYYLGYLSQDKQNDVEACTGAFMFIRFDDLKKVGFFDENFFFYGEDLDLCYRFRKIGYKIIYTPITKIIHYKGAASGMKDSSSHITKATRMSKKKAVEESVRAMEIFYNKHYKNVYPKPLDAVVIFSLKVLKIIRTLKA